MLLFLIFWVILDSKFKTLMRGSFKMFYKNYYSTWTFWMMSLSLEKELIHYLKSTSILEKGNFFNFQKNVTLVSTFLSTCTKVTLKILHFTMFDHFGQVSYQQKISKHKIARVNTHEIKYLLMLRFCFS